MTLMDMSEIQRHIRRLEGLFDFLEKKGSGVVVTHLLTIFVPGPVPLR